MRSSSSESVPRRTGAAVATATLVVAGIATTGCVDARREAFTRHRTHAVEAHRVSARSDDAPPVAAILPGAFEALGPARAFVTD